MGDYERRLFCLLIGVEEWFFLLFTTYWGIYKRLLLLWEDGIYLYRIGNIAMVNME